ncbi:MAG: hypothetical protein AB7O98_13850 [Hyphomonadaceae bacterium]
MGSDSLFETPDAQAQRLAEAFAFEAALDALEPGADPAVVVEALSEPACRFDAAAREGFRA